MLISKQDSVIGLLRRFVSNDSELQIVAEASGGDSALEKVENTAPNVLIINSGDRDVDAINLAERVIQRKPRTFVILLSQQITVDLMKNATAVGCHNVIPFPENAKDFCDAVHRIYNAESGRIAALDTNQRVVWSSKVITVYSAKGGIGKTTIATNLAVRLAEMNKKVVILDLDLQFGDVHVFMDEDPKETISDLVQDMDLLSIDSVRTYMTVHPSGVHMICAPKSPEYADVVSGERIQALIGLLRSNYDYVIVDTATNFSDTTLSALEASTMILLITALDVSTLKNSKVAMNILESLGQKKKVRTIINRAIEVKSIGTSDVQRIVDAPILARLPSDYTLASAALNRGQPFIGTAPKAKLSLAISEIAARIVDGSDNFDIEQLSAKERRELVKKYSTKHKAKQ